MDVEYNDTGSHSFDGHSCGEYVEPDYSVWLWRALAPIIVMLLLPFVYLIIFVLAAAFMSACKLFRYLTWQLVSYDDVIYWNWARKMLSKFSDAYARIYHGYEVSGIENIPKSGAALIIYYHGAVPIDMNYLSARVYLERDRFFHSVADRFLFNTPGLGTFCEVMKFIPGSIESCANVLKQGHILSISPGGVYEAQFSHNYELLWKNRVGFAKVAIEAKAPIIPVFTENIREGYRSVNLMRGLLIKLYNIVRIPVAPLYGGFPVKFRTHLGPPIAFDPTLTPEQLQKKVAAAIEDLINKHQRKPGSIWHALLQRFEQKKKIE